MYYIHLLQTYVIHLSTLYVALQSAVSQILYLYIHRMHYKEYLVVMINRHGLDPVILMTQDEMTNLLHRYDLVAPKQKPKQTPDEHLAQLREASIMCSHISVAYVFHHPGLMCSSLLNH